MYSFENPAEKFGMNTVPEMSAQLDGFLRG